MKVGIIRGPFLNEWEMQTYEFLPENEIEVSALAPKDNFYDLDSIKFPIVKTHQLGHFNRIPFLNLLLQKQFGLNYYLLRFNDFAKHVDILHTAETYHIFTHQSIRSGKPTIVTVWENIPFNWYKKPYIKVIKSTIKRATHFIAITRRVKSALELEGVDSDRISVIPAGVDINKFKPAPKNKNILNKLKIPEYSKVILFIGRLVWEKGIFNLIFAFKKLIKDYKDLSLIIVGNGPEKNYINKLVLKLGLEKKVRFIRKINYNIIDKIYNLADLFCVPSIPTRYWKEQFGMVFVEAMSCGIPVISTCSGSIAEVIDHNSSGILVPPMDNIELTRAIRRILDMDDDKFGKNARKLIEEKFNSEKIAKDLSKLYNNVIDT
jgi:glycosyltransferase involved in cell wall biosynthesis